MPAKSKAQQRLFGMVDAYKKGKMKHASKKIKDIADEMSSKEVKKFAKTKTCDLPETVDENVVRINEYQLRQIVTNCVHDVLCESWRDYAMAGVLGAASMFGGAQKAHAQHYQKQRPDTTQVVNSQDSKLTPEQRLELNKRITKSFKNQGMSDVEAQNNANIFYNTNRTLKNARGQQNEQIKQYLTQNIKNITATNNIIVNKPGTEQFIKIFEKTVGDKPENFKLFQIDTKYYGEFVVLMPINLTLQDVQNEMGEADMFTLDDFK